MVSAETYATTISVIYFSVYAIVFLVASLYCAYEVENRYHLIKKQSSVPKQSSTSKPSIATNQTLKQYESTPLHIQMAISNEDVLEPDITESEEVKENMIYNPESDTIKQKSCFKRWRSFTKYWMKSLWKKKKIYVSIVPHIFDQATDAGVIYTYHEIWRNPDKYPNENES